jgi:hypothetical protein
MPRSYAVFVVRLSGPENGAGAERQDRHPVAGLVEVAEDDLAVEIEPVAHAQARARDTASARHVHALAGPSFRDPAEPRIGRNESVTS